MIHVVSIANGFVTSKIYDKLDDFDFDIVNFPFLDGDVYRRASSGVYMYAFCNLLGLQSCCVLK